MTDRGIRLSHLKKAYNDNLVLDIEEAVLHTGHVYGLIGNNGVGKTTLLQMIAGSVSPTSGTIALDGLKVEMVYQERSLFQEMTVYENMFIGREPRKDVFGLPRIDWKKVKQDTQAVVDKYGLPVDIHAKVGDLGLSVQKLIEIVMALARTPDVLIVDEPLTYLDIEQVHYLNERITDFVGPSNMVIYSSHRPEELFQVIDQVITIKERHLAIEPATDTFMAGLLDFSEKVVHKYPKRPVRQGGKVLEVRHLKCDYINDISFSLNKGEILGIVGLRGAYKSQVGKAIFGSIPFEGRILVEGNEKRIRSTYHAAEAGICYLGNVDEGVFLEDSVIENVVSANVPRARRLSQSAKRLISKHYLDRLNIRYENEHQRLETMSSGNKQKVLLAKWFFSKSKVFIFNKPTSNIDVISKVDIYNIFVDLAMTGAGIILISNNLEEIAGMCDRVLVIEGGRIKSEIPREGLSVHKLVQEMQNW